MIQDLIVFSFFYLNNILQYWKFVQKNIIIIYINLLLFFNIKKILKYFVL